MFFILTLKDVHIVCICSSSKSDDIINVIARIHTIKVIKFDILTVFQIFDFCVHSTVCLHCCSAKPNTTDTTLQ